MLRPFRSVYPRVHPSAFVDASAQVIGDVHIGPESSIWMNVEVRGDVNFVRIGARSNIQDLTLVDNYVRYRLDFQAEHTPA